MGRSPDDLAEELIRRYMRITGAVPTFRDYLDARACAMRELGPVSTDGVETKVGTTFATPVPARSIQEMSAVPASNAEPKKKRAASSAKPAAETSVPTKENAAANDQEMEPGSAGKEKLSDFEILRSVQDEWN